MKQTVINVPWDNDKSRPRYSDTDSSTNNDERPRLVKSGKAKASRHHQQSKKRSSKQARPPESHSTRHSGGHSPVLIPAKVKSPELHSSKNRLHGGQAKVRHSSSPILRFGNPAGQWSSESTLRDNMNGSRMERCQASGCKSPIFALPAERPVDRFDRPFPGDPPRSPVDSQRPYQPTGPVVNWSMYCRAHTCGYFLRRGEQCFQEKSPIDQYCTIHTKCIVEDCRFAKDQYLAHGIESQDRAQYFRYDFCSTHRCTLPDCHSRRALPQNGGISLFCMKHGCRAEKCVKPSMAQSECCTDHECKYAKCRSVVAGKYQYCALHMTCQMQGCREFRHLIVEKKTYLENCLSHATCESGGCGKFKRDRSIFCDNHTCSQRDCNKPTAGSPWCVEHKCSTNLCENLKVSLVPKDGDSSRSSPGAKSAAKRIWLPYCPVHSCRVNNCENPVDTTEVYCKKHRCSDPNCKEKALADQLCKYHFRKLAYEHGVVDESNRRARNYYDGDDDDDRDDYNGRRRYGGSRAGSGSDRESVFRGDFSPGTGRQMPIRLGSPPGRQQGGGGHHGGPPPPPGPGQGGPGGPGRPGGPGGNPVFHGGDDEPGGGPPNGRPMGGQFA